MVDFRNCPVCGGLFRYVSRNICPSCIEVEEKEFDTVRRYIWDHKGVRIMEVSEATGVSEDKIIRFLKDGRLLAKGLIVDGLACDRCGKPISEGKMCEACRAEISQEIHRKLGDKGAAGQGASISKDANLSSRNRMHTADIVKRK